MSLAPAHNTKYMKKKSLVFLLDYRVPSVCGRNLKELFVVLISNSIPFECVLIHSNLEGGINETNFPRS